MSSKIESLWRQAMKTFAGHRGSGFKLCQKNLEKLRLLMNEITSDDVKVDKKVLEYVENQRAPMCVIDIFENQDITIAIFLLKHGVTLPMHDHPGMHGLLKVINGTVKIDSVTTQIPQGRVIQLDEELTALRHASQIVQANDPACVLTPHDHNFHEISCLKGPAAFLDILSPPYDVDLDERQRSIRPCTFFRQIAQEQTNGPEGAPVKVRLLAVVQPPLFYSTNLKYLGPPLR
ncbi:2-aminoethanethiol dioxygenase [Fopius arisanus]|uniref:2-aminoethanethiol dioxygenase n=1 Tax=Fopius arisanus TaxID=64838 RepID=A0A9R1TKL4_9HYME|nr:PREDICTED: 2-aminoethanethiol dioxygenase [Fopius arisanus]